MTVNQTKMRNWPRASAVGCAVICLSLVSLMAACSVQADRSRSIRQRPQQVMVDHDEVPNSRSAELDKTREFEGQWSYRTDCNRGHYVTLELKRDRDRLIGFWSDGTLLRGSQGLLKGRVSEGRLIAAWCSEYEEAGAPSVCPHYDWLEDYFVARDGMLVWYQKYGESHTEYVSLKKEDKSRQLEESCDEEE